MPSHKCVRCGVMFPGPPEGNSDLCGPCGILSGEGLNKFLQLVCSHCVTPEQASRAIEARTQYAPKTAEPVRQVVMPGNYGYYEQLEGYSLAVTFQKKEELQEYIREVERKNRAASGPQSNR